MPSTRHNSGARSRRRGLVAWAFFDWAHSAFSTLVMTFVFAAYFTRRVAEDETSGTALWGTTVGVLGLAVALSGPFLGALADQWGRRKPWVAGFIALAAIATACMWWVHPEPGDVPLALALLLLAGLGAEYAMIFYNAMLPSLAPRDELGRWSGWGWALGYAGGLAALVLALLAFAGESPWFEPVDGPAAGVRAVFPLAGAWLILFALPLLLLTPDEAAASRPLARALRDGLAQLADTVREVRRYADLVRFLVARMIYIDGLATMFALGGVYAAATFDLDEREVLRFGIALNAAAGVGALAFSWIDDRIGSRNTVLLSLAGLSVAAAAVLLAPSQTLFWAAGMALGVFVGPVQSASRSYMAHAAPEGMRTQMFGLFALSGKATAFVGPLLVGWITVLADSQRVGMSVVLVLFVVGAALMLTVPEPGNHAGGARRSPCTRAS